MKKNITIIVLSLLVIVLALTSIKLNRDWDVLNKTVEVQQETIRLQATAINSLRNPQDFTTLTELRSWVYNWIATKLPVIVGSSNGSWQLTLRTSELRSNYWGCDDISDAMQRDALRDGYVLSTALVDYEGKIYGVKVGTPSHTGILASVEGSYWYIEPQTGEMVKIVDRN